MPIVYFTSYNIGDTITLGEVGARNILLPLWYAKKIFGKKHEKLDILKSQFDKVGVFVKNEKYDEKFFDFCEEECNLFINLTATYVINNILNVFDTNTGHAIKIIYNADKFETDQIYRMVSSELNWINETGKILHGINMFNYIQQPNAAHIDSVSVFNWTKTAKYLHCTAYDDRTMEYDTIDYRGEKKPIDIPSKLQLTQYFQQYKEFFQKCNIHTIEELIDPNRDTLLKLPFAVYYMPICRKLKCLEQNFK